MSARFILAVADATELAKVLPKVVPGQAGIVFQRDTNLFKIVDPDGATTALLQLLTVDATGDLATGLHSATYTGTLEASTVVAQTKSVDYTMTKADSGYLTKIDTDGKIITLPPTAPGLFYLFENAGADGAVAVTISPDAADKFQGVGLTPADNKDLVNTKLTAKKGDRLAIVGDGVDGWYVVRLTGTWAREA